MRGSVGRPCVGLLIMMATSCTGGQSVAPTPTTLPTTTTSSTTLAAEAAVTAYVDCLGVNGVEIDPIRLDANGRPRLDLVNSQLDYSDPATIGAIAVCAEYLSAGPLDLGDDQILREGVIDQLTSFSRCVRARGVSDFPDPIPGFIGIGSPYPVAEIPYADPELPAAAQACRQTVFGDFPGSGG